MEQMNDLMALLRHDLQMLTSTEEQIIDALPDMIDAASSPQLKSALNEHLNVSKRHVQRLNDILNILDEDASQSKSILGGLIDGHRCKATEGIIDAGSKILNADMPAEVKDAAIVGAAQKIEHFEIASYGTVRTYAQQLGMPEVSDMLQQTLDEEYLADQELTGLANQKINKQATSGSTVM